ncbi:MAG: iron transporter [Anaerolineaceae bacterium]|nr:iron transporter [Anaerolineaceae bacterium]
MFASFILALREGIEAALIIGIVIGVLQKMDRNDLKPAVWRGTFAAGALSLLVGVILNVAGASFEGQAEEIFEGVAMLLAAGMLTWVIFWMRKQSRNVQSELEADVKAAALGSGGALFAVAFLAVAREGLELVMFLLAARFTSSALQTYLAAAAGLVVAGILGWLLFRGSKVLNLRQFFTITNWLLVFFAAGLVAYGVHELNEAGWIPPVIEHIYNINFLIDENSTLGLFLKALFGYNGNPSLTETAAYLLYFIGLGSVLQLTRNPKTRVVTARQVNQ